MRIADVLQAKAIKDVVTIAPDAGVKELIATLADHNIGALIVSADGTSLDGIVSERDVVRHLHHDGTVINNTVGAIMTDVVKTCSPDDSLDEVMHVMTQGRFRHIPVCDADDALVGIVSIGDLVKHKIDQLQFERDQLDSYVHQM
ncbi:CBS domain-containing protein [Nocardioides thalensis]|uniref:CBS domain-containing protein n=1 Tax=Nocardioides thalensis TaxID=1914755 RepID=A0A853C4J2_9ACTN|nr:CBS domain-containing protein [Nocardioides thalensis]NYJ02147.1 CBS domain-containing protein [Nocardioides thalensis]